MSYYCWLGSLNIYLYIFKKVKKTLFLLLFVETHSRQLPL